MTSKKKPNMLDKPFRVCHSDGDVVAGFDDRESAIVDAVDRNDRAVKLGVKARYFAGPKP